MLVVVWWLMEKGKSELNEECEEEGLREREKGKGKGLVGCDMEGYVARFGEFSKRVSVPDKLVAVTVANYDQSQKSLRISNANGCCHSVTLLFSSLLFCITLPL